jgi:putative phosphoesterase
MSAPHRFALISDIHANLPALDAVLADIRSREIATTYHLGDLIGYAPWPNETIARLQEEGIPGVAGNYDSTVAADYKNCGCRADSPREEELSHLSYEWTRKAISPEAKEFLKGLPFRIEIRPFGGHVAGPTVRLFHATPVNNLVYVTEDRADSFLIRMGAQAGARAGDVICFGHTHKPWHREVSGIHFVNTGSVGRPKDGDPRACWVLLEMEESATRVEFVRVDYDVEKTAAAIVTNGLPAEFGPFLRTGGAAKQG